MSIFEQFGIQPILLVAQIVNFAILLFLLQKFLYKPMLKVLEERKVKIAQSLTNAEEIEKRLTSAQEEQEKILEKARSEASQMLSDAKKETKELSEKLIAETKSTTEEMLKKADERLKLEREQMMTEVKKDLADLVMSATAKVTKKTMDEGTNRQIVEETVKELKDEK